MFIISKNKCLLNDMKIFGACSIPLTLNTSHIVGQYLILDANHIVASIQH